MSFYVEPHGGSCCGLSHVSNFGFHSYRDPSSGKWMNRTPTEEDLQTTIDEQVQSIFDEREGNYNPDTGDCDPYEPDGGVFGHAIEITLTDGQMEKYGPMVKKVGFHHCFRWFNDNSGNYCNLLMWRSKGPASPPPFDWDSM